MIGLVFIGSYSQLYKSYPVGVTQLEIFTLTLTLSLKGEGIAELRKSYPDSDNCSAIDCRPGKKICQPWYALPYNTGNAMREKK